MAGKTFRGGGDAKGGSSRDGKDAVPRLADEDDDPHGLHSGPTVVDDAKVAEVLKKLRTLDWPPGPLTGVTEAVVDPGSSGADPDRHRPDQGRYGAGDQARGGSGLKVDPGPASLQDIMYPLQRPTAIGRSQGTPAAEQPVTIPAELARGTLFGRSIHLPDVNAPDEAAIELSSGAVQIRRRVAVPVAAVSARRAARRRGAGAGGAAPAISRALRHPDTQTDVPLPRSKAFAKVLALIGGVAVVGVAWFGWTNMRGRLGPDPTAAPAAQPAAPPAAPAIEPLPAPPAAAAAAAPAAEGPAPTPAPAGERAAPAPAAARRHRRPPPPRQRPPPPTPAAAPTPAACADPGAHAAPPPRARPDARRAETGPAIGVRAPLRPQGRGRRPDAGEQAQPKPPPAGRPRGSGRDAGALAVARRASKPAIPSDFAALVWYP